MVKFLTLTVIGFSTAGIFAVAASGLVLTYATTGIFNFAHGAIGMLGAFMFWQVHVEWGVPTLPALAIVLLVIAPLTGLGIEAAVMRRLRDTSDATQLVVTVGLLAGALGLGQWLWSPSDAHPIQHFWEGSTVEIGSVRLTYHVVAAFAVAVAVAVGLRILLFSTRAGVTMRAAVDNGPLTALNGARPERSAQLSWAVGCSLAALSGILIAPDQGLQHALLTLLIVNAYAAAVMGRLRSLPLTFLGAVILGLADAYGSGYIELSNQYLSGVRPAIPVLILFIVLLALPQSKLRGHTFTRTREVVTRPTWLLTLLGCGALLGTTVVVIASVTDTDALGLQRVVGVAIVALSLVPLVGWAGQISLCQMSFAGVGAIVFAHHGGGGNPLILVVVALISGLVGALVALPALRLSGIYLALATAAFAVFLDRWIFVMSAFSIGPVSIDFFGFGTLPVDPIHVPGIDPSSPKAELLVLVGIFCIAALVVVGIRRSAFGEQLLALKDSPAACATLGMNPSVVKLAVFSISAAIAGIGGAVFSNGLGTVSAERFSFFESLPILLLAVVGGLGTPVGAVLGAVFLYLIPVLTAEIAWLDGPARVLPGLIGASLGQNPNGAAHEFRVRLRPLKETPAAALTLALLLGGIGALRAVELLGNWWFGFAAFFAPFVVARAFAPRARADDVVAATSFPTADAPREPPDDIEWLGLHREFAPDDVARLNRALSLRETGR